MSGSSYCFSEGEKGRDAALRSFSGLESGVWLGWKEWHAAREGWEVLGSCPRAPKGTGLAGTRAGGLGFDEKEAGLHVRS